MTYWKTKSCSNETKPIKGISFMVIATKIPIIFGVWLLKLKWAFQVVFNCTNKVITNIFNDIVNKTNFLVTAISIAIALAESIFTIVGYTKAFEL